MERRCEKAAGYAEALGHLNTALTIVDELEAPGDIGAHIDQAICRLRAQLDQLTLDKSGADHDKPKEPSAKP